MNICIPIPYCIFACPPPLNHKFGYKAIIYKFLQNCLNQQGHYKTKQIRSKSRCHHGYY